MSNSTDAILGHQSFVESGVPNSADFAQYDPQRLLSEADVRAVFLSLRLGEDIDKLISSGSRLKERLTATNDQLGRSHYFGGRRLSNKLEALLTDVIFHGWNNVLRVYDGLGPQEQNLQTLINLFRRHSFDVLQASLQQHYNQGVPEGIINPLMTEVYRLTLYPIQMNLQMLFDHSENGLNDAEHNAYEEIRRDVRNPRASKHASVADYLAGD